MNGIFLHTGWRTAGTWIWSLLRADLNNLCFYEPLHESLPVMSEADMRSIGANSWPSRHPAMSAPYFAEYLPLLKPGGGVSGAETGFGFDEFFRTPEMPDDALRLYVKSLVAEAARLARRPVLKFTRSLGRVAWFRENFPEHLHAVVAREPWAQFRSAWRCFAEDENPYFLAVPFVILERNARHKPAAALIRALALPVATPPAGNVVDRIIEWSGMVSKLEPSVLYRASFALWLLCMIGAYDAAHAVLDGEGKVSGIAQALNVDLAPVDEQAKTGWVAVDFASALTLADVDLCHRCATGALFAWMTQAKTTQLGPWVNRAARSAAFDLAPRRRELSGAELLRGALPGIRFTF